MAAPMPLEDRTLWPPYLSDLPGLKVVVVCKQCGIRKQFDAAALLTRLDEDTNIISVAAPIAEKMGCERALTWNIQMCFLPQCELKIDAEAMDRINGHLPPWRARQPKKP